MAMAFSLDTLLSWNFQLESFGTLSSEAFTSQGLESFELFKVLKSIA